MSISRVAVVGAGIIGVALAREITSRFPDAEVTVFDKAEHLAAHQSGHTSGIVDPALDAKPGSPEAKLARRGVELLVPFVSERGIPYRECGQLLIAQNTDEADRLEEILARAEANKVPGVRLLDRKEMREVEPNARGVLALYSPHTAVTDF
ncbi:MAG: FAD-dependent oxidoreductase, partial [Brevibacterium sp.]|nr:FAD-dependent oxidoreductase [Brevibacterium sp.]